MNPLEEVEKLFCEDCGEEIESSFGSHNCFIDEFDLDEEYERTDPYENYGFAD